MKLCEFSMNPMSGREIGFEGRDRPWLELNRIALVF